MGWEDALHAANDGVTLDVEVVPGSRESRFPAGYNAWRKRIEAKVRAPPEDGKANAELCAIVAAALGVAEAAVTVSSGQTSRKKTILARGIDIATARAKCSAWL